MLNETFSVIFKYRVDAGATSHVYILSGQKLIKNAKNVPFWRGFEKLKLAVKQCYQTRQV